MARMLLSITAHPLSPQEHQLQHAQLTGKLARLLEELQAYESEPEHASRLRMEIEIIREALVDEGHSRTASPIAERSATGGATAQFP